MDEQKARATAGGSGLWMAVALMLAALGAGAYLSFGGQGTLTPDAVESLSDTTSQPDVTAMAPVEVDPNPARSGEAASETIVEADAPEPRAEEPAPQDTADPTQAETASVAPSVDEIRVDQGGMMVIAGRAAPGSRVDVLVDGEVVTSAEADAGGAFAALGTLAADGAARSLTLRTGDGASTITSDEEIILAPVSPAAPAATPPQEPAQTARADADETVIAAAEETPELADVVKDAATTVETLSQTPSPGTDTPPPDVVAAADEPAAEVPQSSSAEAPAAQAGVSEPERIAVLRSDAGGVSLMQAAPTPPEAVKLDTIGYSDAGVVQLSGRADAGASEVRAYINNRPVARLRVDASGLWRGDVPNVDPGIYTLRIDAVTEDGKVSSRIETPFQREAPDVLAAAESAAAAGPVQAVTVQAGDTLWAIARERYGEGVLFVQVFEANRSAIRDPDLIYPGQVFDLPDD